MQKRLGIHKKSGLNALKNHNHFAKEKLAPFITFTTLLFSGAALAQSGETTYKQVCMSCHGAGVLNAPKLGDKAKWAPLIAEGQVTLTAHGYFGVRAMPAKGGNPNLSIEGFADALVYMVNNSGGNWKSPNPQTIAAINKELEAHKARNKKQ
jgi:cytochrome c5